MWRAHVQCFLLMGVPGPALGVVWLAATWAVPDVRQDVGWFTLDFLAVFLLLGAVAQRWLPAAATAGLAAATYAGHIIAVVNSRAGDEEQYGHEVATPLLVAVVTVGAAVALALLAHALARAALRRRPAR